MSLNNQICHSYQPYCISHKFSDFITELGLLDMYCYFNIKKKYNTKKKEGKKGLGVGNEGSPFQIQFFSNRMWLFL